MGLPNDSILVTPGSGATVATHLVSGKEYQVVMLAHASGYLYDSLPTYYFWSGFNIGAANKKHMSIFNGAGSGVTLLVKKAFIQTNMAAITGVGHVFDFDRITAAPTGGTGLTGRPADATNPAIPAQVIAQHAPTGGATKDFSLWSVGVDPEETRPGSALAGMINWIPEGPALQELHLREGEGLTIIQITSNTAATWGVLLVITTI